MNLFSVFRSRAALLLVTLLLPALAAASVSVPQPSAQQPETAQLVANLLAYQHYRKHPIDDALSKEVLKSYLNMLDPDRYYFRASDIQAFEHYKTRLDDMLLDGDLSAAFTIFKRYEKRVAERVKFAQQALSKPIDLAEQETLDLDRRNDPWPDSTEAMNALWNKRIKNDVLTLILSGESEKKARTLVSGRYHRFAETTEQSKSEDIFALFMSAWSRAFDPHTTYMSPRNSEDFDIQMKLSLEGIGALLKNDRDFTEVVELVPGGPAAQSGLLHPGDRIIGVGQENGPIKDIVGQRLRDVVEMIRGPKDSTVRLRILPAKAGSDAAPHVIEITRNKVKLEERAAKSKVLTIKRGEKTYRIGVVDVPTFYLDFAGAQAGENNYRSTTRDVRKLLAKLEKENIDGLIMDLRGNGGGSLQEAADLTGLFIPGGPVVQIRRSDGEIEVLRDRDPSVSYSGPMAVLVDRYSASASEIFTAAIQDYQRGLVIGERTFGKGTVQTLVDLDRFSKAPDQYSGRLKLTIAKFYRITGSSTQLRGVSPDIQLPATANEKEVGESSEPNALPWDEIKAADYKPEHRIDQEVPLLRARFRERESKDPAFQALVDELGLVHRLRAKTTVSLQEKARRQEHDKTAAERLKDINRQRQAYGLTPLKSVNETPDAKEKEMPDTMLRTVGEVVTDMSILRQSPSTAQVWSEHLGRDNSHQ